MNLTNLSTQINEIPPECMLSENVYSIDCLYKAICPQYNNYFIKVGLIIIVGYIIIMFLKWWFFKYGYRKFGIKIHSKLNDIDKKIYWDTFINSKLAKVMLGYIAIVVYLSLKNY